MLGMSGWGQTTIFSENMGTGASGDPTATAYNGFSNYGSLIFTGTSDIRNNTPSTGYTGSSGNNNALLTTSKILEISNINTTGYTDIVLSFGIKKATNAATQPLKVQVSSDGTTYTTLTYSNFPTASGSTNWRYLTVSGTIPSTINLRIKFTGNEDINTLRLDDVKLVGTPTTTSHTVTFNANGGTGTMAPQIATAATSLTANSFTRLGYEFGGWNTAANGTGTAYTDGQEYDFSADLTLYAQWKPIITYDANGGINPPPAAVTALNGSHIIQSSGGMYRDNYDFINWNTQADGNGTTYTPGATATFTTPTTLYAQWLLCAATIQSISPASGAPVGTEITIIVTADYFDEGVQYDLLFSGSTTPVQATATSDTTIKVTVPTDAKSGTLSISTEQGCPTLTTYTIITNDISGCE